MKFNLEDLKKEKPDVNPVLLDRIMREINDLNDRLELLEKKIK